MVSNRTLIYNVCPNMTFCTVDIDISLPHTSMYSYLCVHGYVCFYGVICVCIYIHVHEEEICIYICVCVCRVGDTHTPLYRPIADTGGGWSRYDRVDDTARKTTNRPPSLITEGVTNAR